MGIVGAMLNDENHINDPDESALRGCLFGLAFGLVGWGIVLLVLWLLWNWHP